MAFSLFHINTTAGKKIQYTISKRRRIDGENYTWQDLYPFFWKTFITQK
jgi:hypothetical protein